jgi:hypothetical protein
MPTLACYETASFNTTSCAWVVTGTQPVAPTGLACYETATFNTTTCSWDVSGSQPVMPTLACYETASFNTTTCAWVVTGTQPAMPTLTCYETASFNTTSCSWVVTGTSPAPVITSATACNSYTWTVNSQSYTSSGSYTSVNNCVTSILNLTINQPSSSSNPIFVCASQVPYSWNGGSYSTSGTYSYSTTNAANCDSLAILVLTVGASIPNPVASVTQPTCATATGTITVTSPIGVLQYSIGGAYQSSTIFSGVASGTYTLSVQAVSGCSSAQNTSVTINAQPFAPVPSTVTGQINVCNVVGVDTTVSYTASAEGATSYAWTLPPNTVLVSGQGTATIKIKILAGFTTQANKQLRVIANSICGSNAVKTYQLTAQYPTTPQTIVASTSNVCPSLGTNVTISYRVPKVYGASSYIWSAQPGTTTISHPNGTGENDTLINVTFASTFTASNITVQTTNDCGTSGVRSILVARANPTTPGLISGPKNICEYSGPTGIDAVYSLNAVSTVTTYTWTIPAGCTNISGQGTSSISFRYPAGYSGGSISVTASNGCGSSGAKTFSVNRLLPSMPGNLDVINISDCPNRKVSYTIGSIPSNSTSLVWTVPPGATLLEGQGTTNIIVSYPTTVVSGNLTVQAFSNCGASSIRSLAVRLSSCPNGLIATNTQSKNEVSGKSELDVSVFPNPSTNNFNLQIKSGINTGILNNTECNVVVMDLQGRVLGQMKTMPNQQIKLGSNWKSGTYFVQVRQGNTTKTMKLEKL